MPRKTAQGEIRDKEKTMQKLLEAVGEILRTQGFQEITVSNVARKAGVDKKLIYVYYENMEGLVHAYLSAQAYWKRLFQDVPEKHSFDKKYFLGSVENYQREIASNQEMGKMFLWEITQPGEAIIEASRQREKITAPFLKYIEKSAGKGIKDTYALLLAGIQFLELQSKANASAYFGLDIRKKKGRESLNNALAKIAEGLFVEAKKSTKKKKKKKQEAATIKESV